MITIAYITNRKEPKMEWFLQSLADQVTDATPKIQIIVIDYYWRGPSSILNISPESGIESLHTSPLPSPIQGLYRLTSKDYFSAGNARNTALVHAKYPYIYFVDDLSVLMPGWLDCAIEAVQGGYCVLGTYEKHNDMVVENGKLVSSTPLPAGKDSRYKIVKADKTPAFGSWWYGNCGMPVELALQVNGYDSICDCVGTEDTQFGVRMSRTGARIIFDRRMMTVESDELHFTEGNYFTRLNPEIDQQQYYALLRRYGINETPVHPYEAAYAILDLLNYNPGVSTAFGNRYDLRKLKAKVESGREITVEDMNFGERFWFTGELWSEL